MRKKAYATKRKGKRLVLFVVILLLTGISFWCVGNFKQSRLEAYSFIETKEALQIWKESVNVGWVKKYPYEIEGTAKENFTDNTFYVAWLVDEIGIYDRDMKTDDFMLAGSSPYSDMKLKYGRDGKEYVHEFFVFDTYLYDLWLDMSLLQPGEDDDIAMYFAENVMAEEYPVSR